MKQKYLTYKEILKIEDGIKAVKILFKRAQSDYLDLFQEMIDQENQEHTLKKAFGSEKASGKIYDSFTKQKDINKNIELFERTANILGEENVIPHHQNLFFDLLFYKFCEDYKYFHKINY